MRVIKCRHCSNETKMDLRTNYIQDLNEIEKDDYEHEQLVFYAEKNWKIYECPVCKGITILSFYRGEDTRISSEKYMIDVEHIYPAKTEEIEAPNEEMSREVQSLYDEARSIFSLSPKSSAALLRLGLQILCKELGEKGDNINDDIHGLVKKGLDVEIQKAFDILRIAGNNAVHPGELNLDENPEIAYKLFGVLNFIVNSMIAKPKYLNSLYEKMPEKAKESVVNRNKK